MTIMLPIMQLSSSGCQEEKPEAKKKMKKLSPLSPRNESGKKYSFKTCTIDYTEI